MYTFFGVAYPVALAVLVLIMYCMNPPVSDGIQGAYFVAVFITGCLCGGVALVFRDLAEGFGCLLGGFCLGMWFLTLKEGGTIPSTVGKAVFIGALTVIVGATGLSHRTRKWGLIGSIPFSGATATILGIDCFSRAGMKEFWIYLWSTFMYYGVANYANSGSDINSDQFPLHTDTYPLTRGMKVEIAGIIILFLIGLVAQIKLSKVLKERKKMLLEKRARKQASAAREPQSVGTRVTSMLRNDQGRYESIYGDKSMTTLTAVPSSETLDKKGFTVLERTTSGPGVEMASIRPSSHRITITDTEGEIQRASHLQVSENRLSATARSNRSMTGFAVKDREVSAIPGDRHSHAESTRTSLAPPAPEVVPLPFKIPGIEVSDARSRGSLSAIEEDYLNQRNGSQRISGGSWKRSSQRGSGFPPTASREDLMMAEQDDDNRSSVAATFDELDEDRMSLSAVTLPRSPMDDTFSLPSHPSNRASIAASMHDGQLSPRLDVTYTDEAGALCTEAKTVLTTHEKRDSVALSPSAIPIPRSEASDSAEKRKSAAISIHDGKITDSQDALAPVEGPTSKRSSLHSDARKSAVSGTSAESSGKLKIVVPQGPSQPLTHEILSEQVADGISRVTLQYRTNEWAKHLENAQQPEEDAMSSPPSPGVQVDAILPGALEHTTLSPTVDPNAPKPAPKRTSTDPTAHRRKKSRSEALAALTAGAEPPLPPSSSHRPNSQRNVSSPVQTRPTSSTTLAWPGPAQRVSRQTSSPALNRQSTDPPVDTRMEDPRKALQKRTSSSKGPKATEPTLMVQRDSRLEAQPKSQSFASSAPNLVLTPRTPAASMHGRASPMPMQRITEDEVIAKPAPVRQNSQPIQHPKPPSRQGSYNPSPVIGHDLQNFDSHQPQRRTSAVISASRHRRENLLTNWRESLREDQNPQKPATRERPDADEAKRARLLQEKRNRQAAREQEKREKAKKEEKISNKMSHNVDMVEAHRRAMLKMQSGVKH